MKQNILSFVSEQKALIKSQIEELFDEQKDKLLGVNSWGDDLVRRLNQFTCSGKMIRGSLICLSEKIFSGNISPSAYRAAAAMELFQSAFLIHDDIMDRDFLRRGEPSIFYQYAKLLEEEYEKESFHLGESLAICAGDIAIFLGFLLLSRLGKIVKNYEKIIALCSQEYSYVGLAQMEDIVNSSTEDVPDTESIVNLYRYKTGRYTFSLPLMIGAMLADTEEENILILSELGEKLGVIFQIVDDELGLLGEEELIGKPIASDLKENKKTVHRNYLLEDTSASELWPLYGAEHISEDDMEKVRAIYKNSDAKRRIDTFLSTLHKESYVILERLSGVGPDGIEILKELVDFNLKRKR